MRQSIKTADADKESWIMEKSERERDIVDLKVLCINTLILLLDASSHLYKSVCPSVGSPSVRMKKTHCWPAGGAGPCFE